MFTGARRYSDAEERYVISLLQLQDGQECKVCAYVI